MSLITLIIRMMIAIINVGVIINNNKYGSETMLWKKERPRIWAVQMDNLRGLLGFRRMDRVPNTWIRELFGVKKGLDERIDEGVFRWFNHVERMESDRITKRVCRRVCW